MAKRKKNKRGRGSVAEEKQSNPAADEATSSPADEEAIAREPAAEDLRPDGDTAAPDVVSEGEAPADEAPDEAPADEAANQAPAETLTDPDAAAGDAAAEDAAAEPVPAEDVWAEEAPGEGLASDEAPGEELAAEEAPAEDAAEDAPAEATAADGAEVAGDGAVDDAAVDGEDATGDDGSGEDAVVDGDDPTGDGAVSEIVDENQVTQRIPSKRSGEQTEAFSADTPTAESPDENVWGDEAPTNPGVGESGTAEEDAKVWESAGESGEAGSADPGAEGEGVEGERPLDIPQMQSIIESLLFASDRALNMGDFKRLLNERDGKKIQAAIEELTERRRESGIHIVHLANGWHLRTNHENGNWVSKLLAGKPMRLSRAMMETLAIVAYRQPVTRPEIDDIRGVDCGPVLKTLLDRGLIRIIGKKEEVGRPMLYGTTPEFLRVFNLRDLSDLPTLREFYELSEDQQAHVTAKHGAAPEGAEGEAAPAEGAAVEGAEAPAGAPTSKKEPPKLSFVSRQDLPPEDEDADPLLDELEDATKAATKALGQPTEPTPEEAPAAEGDAVADGKKEPPEPAEG